MGATRLARPALLLGLLGLGGWLAPSCGPGRPGIRNVVLISIDTLRADHLSSYGFSRLTTPHIDTIAREGVLFRNVYSPVPVTLPAHASMLTGTFPPAHGIRDNLHKRLPDSALTLAELLKSRGLTTAAVVSSFVLDRRFNLSQGFDSYDDRFQVLHEVIPTAPHDVRAVRAVPVRLKGQNQGGGETAPGPCHGPETLSWSRGLVD